MLVRHTILSLCFFSSMLSQKLVIAEAVLQKIDSSQKSRTNSLRGPPVIEQEEIQETRNLAVVDAGSPGNQQRLHDDAKNRWYIQSANKGTYRYTLSRQCNKCNDFGYPWTVVMNAGSPAQAMDKDFKPRTGTSHMRSFLYSFIGLTRSHSEHSTCFAFKFRRTLCRPDVYQYSRCH